MSTRKVAIPPGAIGDLRIEYQPLSEIARWPGNPKKHDAAGIEASIDRWGFNDPVVLDERTGRLIEGHGRLDALAARKERGEAPPAHVAKREDGEWLVPVGRGVSFRNKAEAEGYLLAHNQLGAAGGWDDAGMLAMAKSAIEGGVPKDILGFPDSWMSIALADGGDPDDAFSALPSGDREPFQQMTFTLHDEQAQTITKALARAKSAGDFDGPNENSNGNALARICEIFLNG